MDRTKRRRIAVAWLIGGSWVATATLMAFEAFFPSADFYPNGLALGPPSMAWAAREIMIGTLWAAAVLLVVWPALEWAYSGRLIVVGVVLTAFGTGASDLTMVESYRYDWMFLAGLGLVLIALLLGVSNAKELVGRRRSEPSR